MTKTKVMTPPVITWPVEVEVPRDNGVDKLEIKIAYSYLKISARQKAVENDRPVSEFVHGWDGVRVDALDLYDPDPEIAQALAERLGDVGSPMPYTPENLALKMDSTHYLQAITQGFFNCQSGAKPKN